MDKTGDMSKEQVAGTVFTVMLGVVVLVVFITMVKGVRMGPNKAVIMNCMPIMGNEMKGMKPEETVGEGFAPVAGHFDADGLKPKSSSLDPEWAQKYSSATNGLLDQNFVDNADPRKYTQTRSTCGRRFMSLDLRRVPVPTRDPTTVTSFGLPYIEPECVRFWEDSRPALDC